MNTSADPGHDHAAPTPSPDATPSTTATPPSTVDPQSAIKNLQSNFLPPPIQIQDHIHPTDLLPPNARPFNPRGRKSRRETSAAKSIADLAPGTSYRTLCLADVRARNVDWLWPGRIPVGKVTLLVGDPGVGKSLLALDLAARLSSGAPLPDDPSPFASSATTNQPEPATPTSKSELSAPKLRIDSRLPAPCSVLMLSAEDNLADTIRPRLEALGADLARVITVTADDVADSSLAIPHFDLLIPLLERALDSAPGCRLIIVDPIAAYLGRAVENINSEVRRIMSAFNALAARRRLAILAVSHLRKQQGAALHRAMGSLAFIATARASWLITKDPANPARRLLLPLKNNFATDTTGLAFTILPLPPAEGRGEGPPTIAWFPEPIDVSTLPQFQRSNGRPSDERDEATRWLRDQLAAGVRSFSDIEACATANGFKLTTLRRAFRDLGGEAVRVGYGPLGEWFWRLPGIGDQNPKPTFGDLWKDLEKNTARTECRV